MGLGANEYCEEKEPSMQGWGNTDSPGVVHAKAGMGYDVWGHFRILCSHSQPHTQRKYVVILTSLLFQLDDLTRVLVCEESHG